MIRFFRPLQRAILAVSLAALTGCGAMSAVSDATEPLDAFTLSPLPVAAGAGATGRHLVVELPTSGGELATDRILVKPNRLQAEYLPSGRWVDPAPVLVQNLLVASLQNSGKFKLVGRDGAGLTPDFVLLVELDDFQAEAAEDGAPATVVRIAMTVTMVQEEDQSLIATRRFDQKATASSSETFALVTAFDAAALRLLAEVVTWSLDKAG